MKKWDYCILDDAVKKASSNISINKIKDDKEIYPLYGAKGLVQNISFFQQEEEYLAIIKDGAGIGRISRHPSKSSVVATMQYIIPKTQYNIQFVRYFLESIDFEKYRTGSTIPHIYYKDYKNELFPIVNINEQKQIVEFLDKAFESIEQAKINIEKNIENTKELFQSRLNEIFSQKGDGWEEKELGKLAEFRNGLNFNKSSKGETFKIVGVSNFKDNFYVDNDSLEEVTIDGKLKELDLLKDGDIVAVRSNGNPNLIGRCMLLANIEEKISFSGFTIRIRLIDKNIYPLFLNYFLKSSYIKNELIKSGNGTDIRNLNQQSLSSLVFKYPLKIEEQKRIVNEIDKLSEQTKQLEKHYKQKLKNLEELKKSILQKAFSGELLNDS